MKKILFIFLVFIVFLIFSKKVFAAVQDIYCQTGTYPAGWVLNKSCGFSLGAKGVDWERVMIQQIQADDYGYFSYNSTQIGGEWWRNNYPYIDVTNLSRDDTSSNPRNVMSMEIHDFYGGSTGGGMWIRVFKPDKTLDSLTIAPTNPIYTSGQTQQFIATANYTLTMSNGSKKQIQQDVTTLSSWSVAANVGTINNTTNKGAFVAANVSSQQTGQVNVNYTESGVTKTATANVTVNPSQDFTVALPSNVVDHVHIGDQKEYIVTVKSVGSFNNDVNLDSSVRKIGHTNPPGLDVSFDPTIVHPSPGVDVTSKMTVKVNNQAIIGTPTYFVDARGTANGVDRWSNSILIWVEESIASNISVTGDIYSGTTIGNINIGAKSVVASKFDVNTTNDWKISGYTYNSAMLTLMQNTMNKNITRLKSEDAKTYSGNISGYFNLNPAHGSPSDLDFASKPEGQVWVHSGPLTINGATFSGKGTFIIDGDLTINGDITYGENGSVGFIANNIYIGSGVSQLHGVFYAKNLINIQ